ncbi:MAG: hypothetical protein PHQ64_04515 [Bacilli bacterium]|nr:hypothetical protein [Bacilli bacterium]
MGKIILLIGPKGSNKESLKKEILINKDFLEYNIEEIDNKDNIKIDSNYIESCSLKTYNDYLNDLGIDRLIPILVKTDNGVRLQTVLTEERSKENPDYKQMCIDYMEESIEYNNISLKYECLDNDLETITSILKDKLQNDKTMKKRL